jgi:hypothetical protein
VVRARGDELDRHTAAVEIANARRDHADGDDQGRREPLGQSDVEREPRLGEDDVLIVNDRNPAPPLHVVEVVVLGLDVRADPAQAQEDLPWLERVAIDLPDREVWITSTRSRTAGANHARIDSEQGDSDHKSATDE